MKKYVWIAALALVGGCNEQDFSAKAEKPLPLNSNVTVTPVIQAAVTDQCYQVIDRASDQNATAIRQICFDAAQAVAPDAEGVVRVQVAAETQ